MYDGGRASGSSWRDSIWWSRAHGLPVVPPSEASSWMIAVGFTVEATAVAEAAMVLLHFASAAENEMQTWSVVLSRGTGRLALRRRGIASPPGDWDYTRGVLAPAATALADGAPHKVMLYKTGGRYDSPIELHIDGVLAAKAPGGGDGIPRLVSTACVQRLLEPSSIRNCTSSSNEIRWIDASSNREGNCTTTSHSIFSSVSECDGASGDDLYCVHECAESLIFNGTIHSLHLAHDVSENNLIDHCAPCQPVRASSQAGPTSQQAQLHHSPMCLVLAGVLALHELLGLHVRGRLLCGRGGLSNSLQDDATFTSPVAITTATPAAPVFATITTAAPVFATITTAEVAALTAAVFTTVPPANFTTLAATIAATPAATSATTLAAALCATVATAVSASALTTSFTSAAIATTAFASISPSLAASEPASAKESAIPAGAAGTAALSATPTIGPTAVKTAISAPSATAAVVTSVSSTIATICPTARGSAPISPAPSIPTVTTTTAARSSEHSSATSLDAALSSATLATSRVATTFRAAGLASPSSVGPTLATPTLATFVSTLDATEASTAHMASAQSRLPLGTRSQISRLQPRHSNRPTIRADHGEGVNQLQVEAE